jgi:hypothetical protein
VLIAHSFVDKFLSGTNRDLQAIPNRYRQEVLEEWMEYLGCPADYKGKLRIGGGLSLNAGSVSFHVDHLNDPRRLFDQIAWASIFLESWEPFVTQLNLERIKSFDVPTVNTMFTALVYGRGIVGSQADKLAGVVNKNCPLFQCCVSMINEEEFPTDFNCLEDATARKNMQLALEHHIEDGSTNDFSYNAKYARFPEGNNRFVFLGSFACVWFKFLEKYRGSVEVRHGYEYIAFVMRECNGAPLLVKQCSRYSN